MNMIDEFAIIFNRAKLYKEFFILGEERRIEILYRQRFNVRCFRGISDRLERFYHNERL